MLDKYKNLDFLCINDVKCDYTSEYEPTINEFITNINSKLKWVPARVFSSRKNKNGLLTFICIKDERDSCGNGPLNIFVMNPDVKSQIFLREKYNDVPYLEAQIYSDHVEIINIFSVIHDVSYEGFGYGTMMLKALEKIAFDTHRYKIEGRLSEYDAQTEDEKERRNGFYEARGYTLIFNDEFGKSGKTEKILEKEVK